MNAPMQYEGGGAPPHSKTLRGCRAPRTSARSWSAAVLRRLSTCASALLVVVVLCSCREAEHAEVEPAQTQALFEPDKGLNLPKDVKEAIGVMLVEAFQTNGAITIPVSAIIEGAQETFVYVDSSGYFVRTPVKTGTPLEGAIEITDGLSGGERVVARAVKDLWMVELLARRGGHACCEAEGK